jgi:polysaccharide biosynthesis transport protein
MRPNENHQNQGTPRQVGKNGANGKGKTSGRLPAEQRNLRDYLLMIRERWFIGFAAAVLLVGVLAFYQLRKAPVYEAQASLLFEPSGMRVVDIKEVVDTSLLGGGQADARLQTHIGQMKSTAFFNYVAGTFTEEEQEAIIGPYRRQDKPEPSVGAIVHPGIFVSLNRGTYILTISARHRDPKVAVMIVDRYADHYIEFNRERTAATNQKAVLFLRAQAEDLLKQVERSEESLQDYRRAHNLISLEENQNVIVRHLNGLSASVSEARVARLELDSQLEHVTNYLENGGELMEIDSIAGYGSVANLRAELDNLMTERALLEERYLENHPRMVQNGRSIESVRKILNENIQMAVTELRSRHRRALQHERRLELELAEAEKRSLALEEVAVRYHVLSRQVESNRDAYTQIIDRLNETNIASQLDNVNIKIVDKADMPYLPVEPNLQKIVLQSAFLGCFIFLGLPLGLGILDNKLKAAWEVELLLGLPMLGEVPRLNGIKKRDRAHLISQNQDHAACEAFRGIFSQIQLNTPLDLPRTILITSTVPGEGKSMVCSNLASTFAGHGKRTLLVDCDFRRPSLNRLYERRNDRGIMKWLQTGEEHPGSLDENEALDIVPLSENLHLLRAGGESRNPTEMFDRAAFRALFEEFKTDYDVILVDTPPVGIFPDSLLLARLCDEILYVTQFNRVNKTQIRKFMDKVETARVEMGGIILNGIPSGRTSAYYEYYGYGHVGNKEYQAYYTQKR